MKRRTKILAGTNNKPEGIVDRPRKQFQAGVQIDRVRMDGEEFLLFSSTEPLVPRTYPMKQWRKDVRAMNAESARRSPRPS